MSSTVFLPKKINVGYQKRNDTYTGTLAYVIYYDQKGKLRKQTSWDNWRDKKLDPTEYDNDPTEGFVLNKDVGGGGGGGWGWEASRQAKCRIYDPRGFEFEIEIANLLYILQNTNSIKGKGLEGKFVYGWDAGDIVLIPEAAPEFAQYQEFSDLLGGKEAVKAKDLVLGGTYLTNKLKEVIYLGRFNYHKETYDRDPITRVYKSIDKGLHHFFWERAGYRNKPVYLITKSLSGRIIKTATTIPARNYADLIDELQKQSVYSPYDQKKDQFFPMTKVDVKKLAYFSYDGMEMVAQIQQPYQEDLYYFNYLERREPIKVAPDHACRYGWQNDCDHDPELRKRKNALIAINHHYHGNYNYYDRNSARKPGIPLQELLSTYKPKYRKEFLANGKEKRE